MTEVTLTALQGSIAKWEGIVNGTVTDNGIANCPLCALYHSHNSGCSAVCPVAQKTHSSFCVGSPYEEWTNHQHDQHDPMDKKVGCNECGRLARKELKFLKSLLPQEGK